MNAANETGAGPIRLRKYPNRRYYDASRSRHLTLEGIRTLIREGHDVTVTDSKSGADITAQVLTQIILELDTPKLSTFPVPLLLQLIRVSDPTVKEFIETYFNQAFQSWIEYQKQIQERVRQMQGMPGIPGAFPPFAPWAQAWMAPFGPPPGGPAEPPPGPPQAAASPAPEGKDVRDSLKLLREEVARLRAHLGKSKGRRAKR